MVMVADGPRNEIGRAENVVAGMLGIPMRPMFRFSEHRVIEPDRAQFMRWL